MHSVLVEELEAIMARPSDGSNKETCQEQWKRAFTNCFLKVDAEVGGKSGLEPVAPETVGSTAVVALVCSSHIIVANCGDSRAVLCRGKEPMALSIDHKVRKINWTLDLDYFVISDHHELIFFWFFISQIEKTNMQGLKLLEARLCSGMGIACLVSLPCLDLLVCV